MKITFLLPLCFVKFQQNTTYRLKQSLKTGKKIHLTSGFTVWERDLEVII